ncbi:MAG: hypothetical protein GY868_02925, partial [Deltaproteobacteria bacterium]|nr:hypothetical protein [Deltaproteobacteria bacterium]
MLRLAYRSPADVLPAVHSMLSPSGEAVADEPTRSIIVTDSIDRIRTIRSLLPELDRPGRMLTVRVRFREETDERGRSIAAEADIAVGDGRLSFGRHEGQGTGLRLQTDRSVQHRTNQSLVRVMSGSRASFFCGRDVPFRERWLRLSRRYAAGFETVVFKRVDTGFSVSPVLAGQLVHVDVTPRISYM